MRGLLIYNPKAGRLRSQREVVVGKVADTLRGFGYELEVTATMHRGSATQQVRDAIVCGAEVVFACGGDGTLHECLQGIAGTDVLLAPIPLGSANALCRELRVPLDPIGAAQAYRTADVREVRLSRVEANGASRYFLLMAGAGPDGALMYRMLTVDRARSGRWAYAAHALHLLFRHRFHVFIVRYRHSNGQWRETRAVSAMALRIGSLGGIFPGIARGASLTNEAMRLVIVKPPALLGLPLWFASNWLRVEQWNPLLIATETTELFCESHFAASKTHAQVDGEWFGNIPMRMKLGPESVRLLVPQGY